MSVNICTSGYQYDFWQGKFYPKELPKNKYLDYYSKYFSCVEINNTFYKFPTIETIKKWFAGD